MLFYGVDCVLRACGVEAAAAAGNCMQYGGNRDLVKSHAKAGRRRQYCRLFAGFLLSPFSGTGRFFLLPRLAAFCKFFVGAFLKSNLLQPLRINIIMSHALAKFGAFFLKNFAHYTAARGLRSTAQPTFLLVTTPSLENSFFGSGAQIKDEGGTIRLRRVSFDKLKGLLQAQLLILPKRTAEFRLFGYEALASLLSAGGDYRAGRRGFAFWRASRSGVRVLIWRVYMWDHCVCSL